MIKFEVLGECRAKGRPKFARRGKFVHTYTDDKTVNYENLVKLSFINSGCEPYMNNEPLKCKINIFKSIPKSTSKKKYALMVGKKLKPVTKPDIDNCCKSILDGLNKVAFKDDNQIVELHCYKYYGEEPKVEIEIEVLK